MGGKIYGGTGNIGHLFVYDPVINKSTDLGQALVGISNVRSLLVREGQIYGGTGEAGETAHLFVYHPGLGSTDDLGVAVSGEDTIHALANGADGKIYGGTGDTGHLFSYDVNLGSFSDKGTGAPGGDIYALDSDGGDRLYGGTHDGYLFYYSLSSGTFTDLGTPAPTQYYVRTVHVGSDGKVYGGTGFSGFFFVYDPDSGQYENKGRGVWGSRTIYDLVEGSAGQLFGATTGLFQYDLNNPAYQSPGTVISAGINPAIKDLYNIGYTYDVYALEGTGTGLVFGGGYAGYLFVYDPAVGVPVIRGRPNSDHTILSLVRGTDGLIYGGTYGSYSSSGRLFSYDVQGQSFSDKGQVLPSERAIYALTLGQDDKIYGGTAWNGHLFAYDPATGQVSDKGQPFLFETEIAGLVTAADGTIYGITRWFGHLFAYDPVGGGFTEKWASSVGMGEPHAISAGEDGRIYFGLAYQGHLMVYDPAADQVTDLGQPVPGSERIVALTALGEALYGTARRLQFENSRDVLFIYDIPSGETRIVGQPLVVEDSVHVLTAESGQIYGGTGDGEGHLFSYDPAAVYQWSRVHFSATVPAEAALSISIVGEDHLPVLSDLANGDSLTSVDPQEHPGLMLGAELSSSTGAATPELLSWGLSWAPLRLHPSSLNLVLGSGDPMVISRTIEAIPAAGATVAWSLTAGAPWLAAGPVSGTLPSTLTVWVDRADLAAGLHLGLICLDWETGQESGSEEIAVSVLIAGQRIHLPLVRVQGAAR